MTWQVAGFTVRHRIIQLDICERMLIIVVALLFLAGNIKIEMVGTVFFMDRNL
jgi:hypothetical protein